MNYPFKLEFDWVGAVQPSLVEVHQQSVGNNGGLRLSTMPAFGIIRSLWQPATFTTERWILTAGVWGCLSSWLTSWTPAAAQTQDVLFSLVETSSATSSGEENTHCIEDQAGRNVKLGRQTARVQRADV